MNPLDGQEFSELLGTIKQDMPFHSENMVAIKTSYSQEFPKNVKEYSTKINNEFLNNNLAIIEEISHRDSKHWIPKWFAKYQKRIYGDTEILNHDNFFKAKLHDSFFQYSDEFGMPKNTRYYRPLSIQNVGFLGIPKKLYGALLETITGGEFNGAVATTQTVWNKINGTATIGSIYNQIAAKRSAVAQSGNYKQAIYDHSSAPNALLGQTASTAVLGTSTYTFQNLLADATVTTTQLWCALQQSSAGNFWVRKSPNVSGELYYREPTTYGTMPDPAGATSDNQPFIQKIQGA